MPHWTLSDAMRGLQLAVDVVATRQAMLQRGAPKDAEGAWFEITSGWLSRRPRCTGRVHLLAIVGLGPVLRRVKRPANPWA